jgi:hypothetical protein
MRKINKFKARYDTVIDLYRKISGNYKIPDNQSYITLCASQVKNGCIHPKSELNQLYNEGLITYDQFYGIDIDDETIKQNKVIKGSHWICDDLLNFLQNNVSKISYSLNSINYWSIK